VGVGTSQEIGWDDCLQNDMLSVERDIKLYSLYYNVCFCCQFIVDILLIILIINKTDSARILCILSDQFENSAVMSRIIVYI